VRYRWLHGEPVEVPWWCTVYVDLDGAVHVLAEGVVYGPSKPLTERATMERFVVECGYPPAGTLCCQAVVPRGERAA
jgi:hypothetical protein